MITCIIVGAGGRGMDSYAPYIKESKIMKIVGVAEPDERKRKKFCSEHAVSENMAFSDYRELFEKGRLADAVIICTHDRMHLEPTLLAIKCGYHILLEKPVSPDIDELLKIETALKGYNRVFMTGYVLRYTPFIQKIKELIDSDEIGKIMSVQLNENEGYWHHAHSYVRGQWNRTDTSAPLIVAKSCHDMDLLTYLIQRKCISISSYGGNDFFIPDNAPEGAPLRCTDGCKYAETCQYNAIELYTNGKARYFLHKFGCDDTKESIIDALKSNCYGKCVFRCDNDVCDHQVACFEFENGITAVFTVSAFSLENNRTLKIMGTKGEIGGCMELGDIVLKKFINNQSQKIHIEHDNTKHCGGDSGLINAFVQQIRSNGGVDFSAFESHKMAFAAEKSRSSNSVQLCSATKEDSYFLNNPGLI